MMTKALNDNDENDPMPFVSIAAATANALRFLKLDEQSHEQADDKSSSTAQPKDDSDGNRKYVQQRLRELQRFERRANGGK